VLDVDPALPPQKNKGEQLLPIFDPRSLWSTAGRINSGWIKCHFEVGLRPKRVRLCVIWGSSCRPQNGGTTPAAQFSAHVYCGQTARWMKVLLLGREVGLGSGDHICRSNFDAIYHSSRDINTFGSAISGCRWLSQSLGPLTLNSW